MNPENSKIWSKNGQQANNLNGNKHYNDDEVYCESMYSPAMSLPCLSSTGMTPSTYLATPQSMESCPSYSWWEHDVSSTQDALTTHLIYPDIEDPLVLGSDEALIPPFQCTTEISENEEQTEFEKVNSTDSTQMALTSHDNDLHGLPMALVDYFSDKLPFSGPISYPGTSLMQFMMGDLNEIMCMSRSFWDYDILTGVSLRPPCVSSSPPPSHQQYSLSVSDINERSSLKKKPWLKNEGSGLYSCPFCNRPYSRRQDCNRHVNSKHTKTRLFYCQHHGCSKDFSRLDVYKKHLRTKHK